jgi:hypothetical protein
MNSFVVNLYPKPNGTAAGQNLTVGATAVQFDPATFDYKTNAFFVTVHTHPVIVTFDGTTPTASNGHVLPTDWYGWWSKDAAIAAKLLRHTSSSSQVTISQFTN